VERGIGGKGNWEIKDLAGLTRWFLDFESTKICAKIKMVFS
jgi:hypothetical protein